MSSVLVLLPLNEPRVNFVLSCPTVGERWIYLVNWLTERNISLCSREQHGSPNDLNPNNVYCVTGGSVADSFLLFQVNITADWNDPNTPAPKFTSDIGFLVWTDLPMPIHNEKRKADQQQPIDETPVYVEKADDGDQSDGTIEPNDIFTALSNRR